MYSKREIKNNTPKKNSEKNSPKKDFKFDWNFLNRYINIIESEFFTSKMFQKYMLQEIDISIKKFGISFSELFPILMKNNFDFNLVKKFLSNYKCKNLLIEKKEILCEICGLLSNKNFMMDCGHSYCQDCIKDYIKYNLQNFGSDAINRTCPTQGCEFVITFEQVEYLFGSESKITKLYKNQFYKVLIIAKNKSFRNCPINNCKYIFKIPEKTDGIMFICPHNHKICGICSNEYHSLIPCSTIRIYSENSEFETSNSLWILANSKKCPSCHKNIDKNGGCNHMTCKLCRYEFCWLCLSKWKEHKTNICLDLQKELELQISEKKNFALRFINFINELDVKYPKINEIISKKINKIRNLEIFLKNKPNFDQLGFKILNLTEEALKISYFGIILLFLKKKEKKIVKIKNIYKEVMEIVDIFEEKLIVSNDIFIKMFNNFINEKENIKLIENLAKNIFLMKDYYMNIDEKSQK